MKLLRLALPVYVELLTAVVAVSVIDLLWVAGLGNASVAAVTVAATTEYLLFGVMLTVSVGVTVLVGRGGDQGAAVRTGWVLCWCVGLALAVPGVLMREQLAEAFADGDVARLAAEFFAVSLAALPVYFAQVGCPGDSGQRLLV